MKRPCRRTLLILNVIALFLISSTAHSIQYSGDIKRHCKEVSDFSGGSYVIEKSCRDMETEAKNKLARMNAPQRIVRHCREVADFSGKSYSIMVSCVEMEIEAKNGM